MFPSTANAALFAEPLPGDVLLWVLPNPSGLNAHHQLDDLVVGDLGKHWQGRRPARDAPVQRDAPAAPRAVRHVAGKLAARRGDFRKAQQAEAPTKGRSLDHIGFEVKNLEAFTKKLEADGIKLDRPYTKVAALGIAIAFIKDPWGTYIELTEGLDKVP